MSFLPAPKYTPAPHLIKSSSLTAEDIISHYKDFYENLKDNPSSPSLVFERIVANLISSLTKPQAPTNDPDCAAALEKCRNEKKTLRLNIDKLKAELKAAQTKLVTTQRGLETAQKELAEAQKELPGTEIVGTGCRIGDFRSAEGASKDISFSKPYSVPPGIIVGLRSIDTVVKGNILRATCYATYIRNGGFRIHNGEPNPDNVVDSMAHSSWLMVPPNDPDFQYGTISVAAAYPTSATDTRHQITFARPYHKPPQVVVYFSSLEVVGTSIRCMALTPENITTTGFSLRTTLSVPDVSVRLKCTVSWVSCPESMPNACMGTFQLYPGQWATSPSFIKFNSGSFTTPPRVLLAISLFFEHFSSRVSIMADTPKIGVDGFTWNIQTKDHIEGLRFSYIALG